MYIFLSDFDKRRNNDNMCTSIYQLKTFVGNVFMYIFEIQGFEKALNLVSIFCVVVCIYLLPSVLLSFKVLVYISTLMKNNENMSEIMKIPFLSSKVLG